MESDLQLSTAVMVDDEDCGGKTSFLMDIFVVVKALVITYFSVEGILMWRRHKFNAFPVICTLIVSIGIVSEIAERKSNPFCLR